MIISSKGRYALRVMVYLAVHHSDEYIPLKEISDKEELSKKYLETITRMLSKANLIEAASGHGRTRRRCQTHPRSADWSFAPRRSRAGPRH